MLIAIDMDGVLCSEERTFERSLGKPIEGAQEAVKTIRNAGHRIVIFTARSWAEQRMTTNWLEHYGFEYDMLVMGKPPYDVMIDDRAIRFGSWKDVLADLEIPTGEKKKKAA